MIEESSSVSSEIYLKDILKIIYLDRFLFSIIVLIFSVVSIIYSLSLSKVYKSEILISLSQGSSSSSVASSLASTLLGSQDTSLDGSIGKSEALAILESRKFIEEFLKRNDYLPNLFKDDWDRSKGTWKNEEPPTIFDGYELILGSLDINEERNLIYISYKSYDKELTSTLLNDLIKTLNDVTREEAISLGIRNLQYLENQASKNKLQSTNLALSSIIEQQIQKNMLANGKKDFAFKIIDPARTPLYPFSPNRKLIVFLGTLLGTFLASIFILLKYSKNNNFLNFN